MRDAEWLFPDYGREEPNSGKRKIVRDDGENPGKAKSRHGRVFWSA